MRLASIVLCMLLGCGKDSGSPSTEPEPTTILGWAELERAPAAIVTAAKACDAAKPRDCMQAASWLFDRASSLHDSDRYAAARAAGGAQAAYARACATYEDTVELKKTACRLVSEIAEERAKQTAR